jgi:hypothetical protein
MAKAARKEKMPLLASNSPRNTCSYDVMQRWMMPASRWMAKATRKEKMPLWASM